MRIIVILIVFLFSSVVSSQEIGFINNGKHTLKLLKLNDKYALTYSDINSTESKVVENTFHFAFKESIYSILMDGFKNKKSHQIILKTGNDTIIKFQYNIIDGERLVKIMQNNLLLNTFGSSSFFKKDEIEKLFGNSFKG